MREDRTQCANAHLIRIICQLCEFVVKKNENKEKHVHIYCYNTL